VGLLDAPYYTTGLGKAYLGDSLELMEALPAQSVNLVMTSPPFALVFKNWSLELYNLTAGFGGRLC
jgi:DNA modification methylase